jgi:hypothetical protein
MHRTKVAATRNIVVAFEVEVYQPRVIIETMMDSTAEEAATNPVVVALFRLSDHRVPKQSP